MEGSIMTEKWKELIDLICEINRNNFEVFNANIVYHYFRRFQKDLPFNFALACSCNGVSSLILHAGNNSCRHHNGSRFQWCLYFQN